MAATWNKNPSLFSDKLGPVVAARSAARSFGIYAVVALIAAGLSRYGCVRHTSGRAPAGDAMIELPVACLHGAWSEHWGRLHIRALCVCHGAHRAPSACFVP